MEWNHRPTVGLQFRGVESGRGVDPIHPHSSPPESRTSFPTESWPSPGRGSGDIVAPGSLVGPGVNHLLEYPSASLAAWSHSPLGESPKKREAASQPGSAPQPRGNGLMLLATETGGPSENPQSEGRGPPCPHRGPRLAGGRIQPQLGERTWKGHTFEWERVKRSWGRQRPRAAKGRDPGGILSAEGWGRVGGVGCSDEGLT